MNRSTLRNAAFVATLVVLGAGTPEIAEANTPEDLQGVSARTNAMGGAGTALPGDYTAAYYNPGALAFCRDNMVGVDIRQTVYDLGFTRRGPNAPVEDPKPLRNQTRVTAGACLKLPFNLAAGISFGVGLQNPMTLDQSTPNPRPQYVMYGESLEQLSVGIGFAYRPIRQFAFGFGGSILVNSALGFTAKVPVAQEIPGMPGVLQPLDVNIRWDLIPTGAPYVGVLVAPIDSIRFGITYRGPLYHNLDTPANIEATLVGLTVPIPLQIESIGWYSPRQLAIGMSADPVRDLTVTADVTWYGWGSLNGTAYPFLNVTPADNGQGVTSQTGFPTVDNPGWKDVWALRVGGELRLFDERVAVRGGYGFRSSGVNLPNSSNVNLLDGAVHSITLGGGYFFGRRPNHPEDNEEPSTTSARREGTETPAPDTAPAQAQAASSANASAARPAGASATASTARSPSGAAATPNANPSTGRSPSLVDQALANNAEPEATANERVTPAGEEPTRESGLPNVNASIDVFFRANLMPQQYVEAKNYSFGGNIYDFGLMMTLGWY